MSIIADGPEAVKMFRLIAMKSAVKLEASGLTHNRGNVTALARKELGLKRNAPHDEVIAAIQAKVDEMHEAGVHFTKTE